MSENFKTKESIKFYYDNALKNLSRSTHTNAGEFVHDILVESCLAEREWDSALTAFLTYIKENGFQIETPQEDIQRLVQKLFALRFLQKMINAMGLSRYEEKIINLEIENKWGKTIPTVERRKI